MRWEAAVEKGIEEQTDTERKEIEERHSVGEGEDFGKRLGSCRHKPRSATL